MTYLIESVLTGQPVLLAGTGEASAIAKTPVAGSRAVGLLGITGDAQADLSVHGGPDKAIHHYPRDHYGWWRDRLGPLPVLETAGAFGENISTFGLTEDVACIGDRYRLGTALVEIAQGRQPCWKQAHRLGDTGAVAAMVKSGRSGWYYRVIEPGQVGQGDTFSLLARPYPEWTVARVTGIVIAGREGADREVRRALGKLTVLAEGWRTRAAELAAR